MQVGGDRTAHRLYILLNGFGRPLSHFCAVGQVHAAHPGLRSKFNICSARRVLARIAQMTSKLQCGLALWGIVMQACQGGAADQFAAGGASHGEEIGGQAVAVGDGAGFIQNHGVHIAAGLHSLAGHSDDIEPGHAVHTCNADGGKQAANGRRDQAYAKSDQGRSLQLYAGIQSNRIQRYDNDQKNDGQRDQKRIQRDFVGRLFSGSAFDQSDHAVKKAAARVRGDADFQPVGYDRCAAGHRTEIAAGFPHHRSGLTCDGRLVYRSDAFNNFSVSGDDLARLHHNDIAFFQFAGQNCFLRAVLQQQTGLRILLRLFQTGGLRFSPSFRH